MQHRQQKKRIKLHGMGDLVSKALLKARWVGGSVFIIELPETSNPISLSLSL